MRDLLADIVENSEDAIFSRDLDGIVTSWNRAAERIFGYAASEIIGRDSVRLLPPDRQQETQRIIEKVRRGERVQQFETVRVRKNGESILVALSASPIRNRRGTVIGVSTIARDITAERDTHNQLLEAGERERARVGRDLHDGLGQQMFGLELVCRSLHRALLKRGLPEAHLAWTLMQQMQSAIRDLRGFSRGLAPVLESPDGLMQALENLAETTRSIFRVSCVFECDEPVLMAESASANHLFRIAQEAVTNAVRHGRARRIDIRLRRKINNLSLEICDLGQPFLQPRGPAKGTGLRAMQYRATRLGGSLTIRNIPKGVIVSCTVPLRHLQKTRPSR